MVDGMYLQNSTHSPETGIPGEFYRIINLYYKYYLWAGYIKTRFMKSTKISDITHRGCAIECTTNRIIPFTTKVPSRFCLNNLLKLLIDSQPIIEGRSSFCAKRVHHSINLNIAELSLCKIYIHLGTKLGFFTADCTV